MAAGTGLRPGGRAATNKAAACASCPDGHPDLEVQATRIRQATLYRDAFCLLLEVYTYYPPMLTHYERNLPHILPPDETIFITFRLYGSLPADVIDQLAAERKAEQERIRQSGADATLLQKQTGQAGKRYFARFDALLDMATQGNAWLKQPAIADIVQTAIRYGDGRSYTLHAYCIMPNHVHLLVTILSQRVSFTRVLQSLKGFSARQANALLNRTGQPFWQAESYDHVVRNADEFNRIVSYILHNPVKAGLVSEWEEYPYSYVANL